MFPSDFLRSHISCSTRKTKQVFSYLPKSSFCRWKPPSKIGVLNIHLIVAHNIKAVSSTMELNRKVCSHERWKMCISQNCQNDIMGVNYPKIIFDYTNNCQTRVNSNLEKIYVTRDKLISFTCIYICTRNYFLVANHTEVHFIMFL